MSRYFSSILDNLEKNLELLNKSKDQIKLKLLSIHEKKAFFEAVDELLERSFRCGPLLISVYVKILEHIADTVAVCENNQAFTVKVAYSRHFTKRPGYDIKSFEEFCQRIPILVELCKLRLLQTGSLTNIVTCLTNSNHPMKNRYTFEILRIANILADHDACQAALEKHSVFWCHCVSILKKVVAQSSPDFDEFALNILKQFLLELEKKERWQLKENALKRKASQAPSETCSKLSREESLTSRPLPPPLLTGSFALISRPISQVMTELETNPGRLNDAVTCIRAHLNVKTTMATFTDAVFDILNAAFSSKSEAALTNCIKLLDRLRDVKFIAPDKSSSASLADAVSSCTIVYNKLTTLEEVDKFAASFRLTNELYRVNFVPVDLFKFYVTKMADGNDEITMTLLFRIVANVHMLFKRQTMKLVTEEDAEFWTRQSSRLALALQRNILKNLNLVKDVETLLENIRIGGGWNGKSFSKQIVESKLKSILDKIALGQDAKIWLWPLCAHLKDNCSPYEFVKCLEQVLEKLCEQVFNEATCFEAGVSCSSLNLTDFGRAKKFATAVELFLINYLSGKNASDCQQAIGDEPNKATEITALFERKKQGCIMLTTQLYRSGIVNHMFMKTLFDSLLNTKTDAAFDSLMKLVVLIGKKLVAKISESGLNEWWVNFCQEIGDLSRSDCSETSKKLIASILAEIGRQDAESEQHALDLCSQLLNELNADLKRISPDSYNALLKGVEAVVAKAFPEKFPQQMFDLFLKKLDCSLSTADIFYGGEDSTTPLPEATSTNPYSSI